MFTIIMHKGNCIEIDDGTLYQILNINLDEEATGMDFNGAEVAIFESEYNGVATLLLADSETSIICREVN
jgi:hypothetical protein